MTVVVAPEPLTRRERLRAPLTTIGVLSLATAALAVRDPHQRGSWGVCPLSLAGVWCPGCGGLRAVNDLTRGDVAAAASSNLIVTLGIPVAVLALLVWLVAAWRGVRAPRPSPATARALWWAGGVAVAVFTVVRNTPAGAWLAP